jgi:hypothetical protein
MSEDIITKDEASKANWWQCNCKGHSTLVYYATKIEKGEKIVKASIFWIKKGTQNDCFPSVMEKQATVVATVYKATKMKKI